MKVLTISLLVLYSCIARAQLEDGVNYRAILKRASEYSGDINGQLPAFTYQPSNDSVLVALRKNFKLDSIAGDGDEASRLINLLHWVHNTVRHDGQHESGITSNNAEEIINTARSRDIGVSCGELATTLSDCYLAMGWKSRKIYCFPKNRKKNDHDSHVINAVYFASKEKWIWMDPTNDAYVMDENGELLSIEEVREGLITGRPLVVNPDANWNHQSKITREYYLDTYMAKNLYRFYSPLSSEYNYESWGQNRRVVYVYLYPLDHKEKVDFRTDDYLNPELKTTFNTYNIFNQKMFWQSPREE